MIKFSKEKYFIFSIFLSIFLFLSSVNAGENLSKQRDEIDKYLSEIYKTNEPGAAVLVTSGGKVILRKGYGLADMELNVPVIPENVFRIGSITKQFTAVAIMMLVEEGKVKLEDLLTVYLPDYPLKGKKVTVEHLLNHTSGIKSYTSMPEFMKMRRKDLKVEEIIDVFKNEPFDFEPGEKFLYNNSGYILLGAIIEKVTGEKYDDFIKKRIFKKSGMKNSSYGNVQRIIKNRAKGYGKTKDGYLNASYLSMTLPYAAGSLLSTVDDLYKWNRVLNSGKLISKKYLKKIYKKTKLNNGEEISYCFGFMNIEFRGFEEIHHGGGINGFISNKLFLPEKDIFVTILSNSTGNEPSPQFVSQWIAAYLIGKPYKEDTAKILPEKELDEYVGVYQINKDETRSVVREGNSLFTLRSGSRKLEAFNRSVDTFFYKKSFTWFTFERDKKTGNVIGMTMNSLSGKDYAKKTGKKPVIKKAVKIDESVYNRYTGRFKMAGFDIVILVREGKIFAQPTGQSEMELFPLSETRFFFKDIDAEIEFSTDKSGNFTGLVLHQGKVKLEGKKI